MELPEIGDVFATRYEIVGLLGVGGFAHVLRARDTKLGRDVALKITSPTGAQYSAKVGQRFLREAAVLAGLHDPHTITLYDFGESDDGLLYMAFEFVDGEDLTALVARGPLEPDTTVHILLQLLSSLREAHGHGVLHRDIKPSNVMVYEYGGDPFRVKLLDFGVAKPLAADAPKLTKTGAVLGTPRYMAPEQAFAEPLTPATDIYSLGLLAFEMLTGRPAIKGKTQREILRNAVSSEPFMLPDGVASPELCDVVEKMIERRPHARYGSVDEVQDALATFRQPIPVVPDTVNDEDVATVDDMATVEDLPPTVREAAHSRPARPTRGNRHALVAVLGGAVAVAVGVAMISSIDPAPVNKPALETVTVRLPPVPEPDPRPVVMAQVPTDHPEVSVDAARDAGGGAGRCEGKRAFDAGITTLRRGAGRDPSEVLASVPPGYDPTRKYGLIVMYHDFSQEPQQLLESMELNEVSDLEPFLVIAPRAPQVDLSSWARAQDWSDSLPLVGLAYDELCIDPDRVFALGHGMGAGAAYRSMCAGGFAGLATTSHRARPNELAMCPDIAIPYLSVTTSDDPLEPVRGGTNCALAPVISHKLHRTRFMERHTCDKLERRWSKRVPPTCVTWGCEVPLVLCDVEGGRQWRGDSRKPDTCPSGDADFPHTRTIWQFFAAVSRSGRIAP